MVPLPDNPIRTIKDINMHVLSGYRPHQDPSLPWTKFGNYISRESRLNLECNCVVFRRTKAGQNPKKKSELCSSYQRQHSAGEDPPGSTSDIHFDSCPEVKCPVQLDISVCRRHCLPRPLRCASEITSLMHGKNIGF